MKRVTLILLVLLSVMVLFTACVQNPPATEEPAIEKPATEEPAIEKPATEEPAAEEPATEEPAAKKLKKLGLVHSLQAWTMYQVMEEAIKAECDANGIELVVSDANYDAAKQAQQIETMINSGVEAIIVITVDGVVLEPVAKKAQEKGVALISMYTPMESATAEMLVDEYDYGYKIGTLGGEYYKENFPGETIEVALLRIFDYVPGMERAKGMEDALKEIFPTGVIVNSQNSVDVASAMIATEAIIAGNPEVKLFLCDSDDTGAIGAYQVLKAKIKPEDYDQYCVIGADGVPEAFKSIKENGMYRGTVALQNDEIGRTAFTLAKDIVEGNPFEKVQYCQYKMVDYEEAMANY